MQEQVSGESEQLSKLKEYQTQLLENSKNIPDEELKRLKQVVRNRISAQQSRDKKKCYVADMEVTNNALESSNTDLRTRIERIQREN
jgi:hypothetical protein